MHKLERHTSRSSVSGHEAGGIDVLSRCVTSFSSQPYSRVEVVREWYFSNLLLSESFKAIAYLHYCIWLAESADCETVKAHEKCWQNGHAHSQTLYSERRYTHKNENHIFSFLILLRGQRDTMASKNADSSCGSESQTEDRYEICGIDLKKKLSTFSPYVRLVADGSRLVHSNVIVCIALRVYSSVCMCAQHLRCPCWRCAWTCVRSTQMNGEGPSVVGNIFVVASHHFLQSIEY